MGQKAKPKSLRLCISDTWDSRWCASSANYPQYLLDDYKIREHIKKEFKNAIVSKILISRKSQSLYVDVFVARPGIILGKKGMDIKLFTEELRKSFNLKIHVSIKDIKNIDADASTLAQSIATQLEKRIPFRRAMKQVIQKAMKAGAKGVKVECSGRLGGVEIARTETSMEGSIPLHTFRAIIDYSFHEAFTIYGKCGVKVWVYKGQVSK